MVDQKIIDEAKARGIVPGARVACAYGRGEGTVDVYDEWQMVGKSLWCGRDDDGCSLEAYNSRNDRWATVLPPAPQAAAEGLVDGDACECGPSMRAAIIELAKELGVQCSCFLNNEPTVIGLRWVSNGGLINMHKDVDKAMHIPEAFIAKMRVEATKPKPIRIQGHEVKCHAGFIQFGGTTIDNATVRAIAANLKD